MNIYSKQTVSSHCSQYVKQHVQLFHWHMRLLGAYDRKRHKKAMITKMRNHKEIPTPKTEVRKTKLKIRYLYL